MAERSGRATIERSSSVKSSSVKSSSARRDFFFMAQNWSTSTISVPCKKIPSSTLRCSTTLRSTSARWSLDLSARPLARRPQWCRVSSGVCLSVVIHLDLCGFTTTYFFTFTDIKLSGSPLEAYSGNTLDHSL